MKNDDLILQANFDNGDFAAVEFVVVVVSGENGCGNAVVVVAEKKIREIEILKLKTHLLTGLGLGREVELSLTD